MKPAVSQDVSDNIFTADRKSDEEEGTICDEILLAIGKQTIIILH
jgi:hypothetical protein